MSYIFTPEKVSKLSGIEAMATQDQSDAEIKTAYENNADTNAYDDAAVSKLAGIEASATADQSDAEIKTAYEANADTNAYDDAAVSKLAGIELLADVTDATNVDAAGAVMNSDASTAAMSFVVDEDNMSSDSATKVPTQQSVKAYVDGLVASGVHYQGGYNASTNSPDLDVSPSGVSIGDMYAVTVAGNFFSVAVEIGDVLLANQDSATLEAHWDVVQANLTAASIKTQYESNADTNAFTDADESKLDGIEASATADQSDAEIKTAYENNANTNAFTDADESKLDGIELLADVTDSVNVDAAGAVMESDANVSGMTFFSTDEDFDVDPLLGADRATVQSYVLGEISLVIASKEFADSPYTADARQFIPYNVTGGSSTVNLPSAVGLGGDKIIVKKTDSSGNTVTLDGDGTETIDGALTLVLTTQNESATVVSDNSNWFII